MDDEAMFCREQAVQLVSIRAELYREEAVTVSFQQVAQVRKEYQLRRFVPCPTWPIHRRVP